MAKNHVLVINTLKNSTFSNSITHIYLNTIIILIWESMGIHYRKAKQPVSSHLNTFFLEIHVPFIK